MDDEELSNLVNKTNIFAKLFSTSKSRIINILKNKEGILYGLMGDGINDLA